MPNGSRSMKTLDCSLVEYKRNDRKTIRSTRVSEIDAGIPQLLGVSKAILESVIFCHQEESLWPMSEPAPLKKRFDEIFEAQKYIKAIDHLKKIGKEKTALHRIAQNDHLHLTERKKAAASFKKRMEQLLREMSEIDDKISALAQQAEEAEENEFTAMKAASEFTEVIERLKAARTQKAFLQDQLQILKNDLQQRPEPDETLQQELDEFEGRMSMQRQHYQEQTRVYESLGKDINRKVNEIGDKKGQAGKFEAQKADHERNIKNRGAAIKKSAEEHNITGYNTDLDAMQINEYMEKISKLSKDQITRLDRLRLENQNKQMQGQTLLDGLRRQQTALEANRSSKKDQIATSNQRLKEAHEDLERYSVDEAGVASLQEKVKEIEASIQTSKLQFTQSNIDVKLRNANTEIQQLESQEALLTAEFREASKRAADLAAVGVLQKNLKDIKRDLDSKISIYRGKFSEMLGDDWQIDNIEHAFQKVQKNLRDKVAAAKKQYDGAGHEVERLDDTIKRVQTNIVTYQKEADQCAKLIRDKAECEPDAFPGELDSAKQNRDTSQTGVDSFAGMKKFFEDAISMAEHDKKCKLCRRGFKETKEIDMVVSSIKKQFSDQRQKEMQAQLEDFIQDLAVLEEVSSSYSTWLRLTSEELPPLRDELQKLTAKRTQFTLSVDKEEMVVAEAEEAQREAEKLTPQVNAIVNYRNDRIKLEAELEHATAGEGLTGTLRTIDDINVDVEKVRIRIKELRQAMARYQADERQLREQISRYTVDLGEAKNHLSTANHQLEAKASINKQIAHLKQTMQELRKSISELETQVGDLLPQVQSKAAELNRQQAAANDEERSANQQANKLSAEVKELMQLDYNITRYNQEGGPANLANCRREIQALEEGKSILEAKYRDARIQMTKINDEINNQDRVKRVIVDNLKYRKTRQDFKVVEQEIARLAEQNAEADQEQHRREAHRWQQLKDSANTARAGEMARKKEKDNQYNEIEDNIEQHYKDVDHLYTKANIEVITLSKIVKDLSTYATALNKAIMEYHGTKMEQINRIIAELWTATYQGTDIDTICIRSEDETTRGNRSYNYRVTMIKQNVEMDMRGRCSAGQRVLASIIIRLALAECFSEYCGMIALDEPTTNLDRENIRSLAESLHEIINARKSQANFQLIVITHDEDFLKVMRPSDHADRFYRIQRNQRQKSEIVERSMFEL